MIIARRNDGIQHNIFLNLWQPFFFFFLFLQINIYKIYIWISFAVILSLRTSISIANFHSNSIKYSCNFAIEWTVSGRNCLNPSDRSYSSHLSSHFAFFILTFLWVDYTRWTLLHYLSLLLFLLRPKQTDSIQGELISVNAVAT